MNKIRGCESCRYYRMIDSAYGYCVRYPPELVLAKRFPRVLYDALYPHIEWDGLICGEFKKKA